MDLASHRARARQDSPDIRSRSPIKLAVAIKLLQTAYEILVQSCRVDRQGHSILLRSPIKVASRRLETLARRPQDRIGANFKANILGLRARNMLLPCISCSRSGAFNLDEKRPATKHRVEIISFSLHPKFA